MKETIKLTNLERDALREVMSMGMGHSSIALSKMVDEKIDVKLAAMNLIPLSEVSGKLGGEDVLSTGVYLRVIGDVSGTTLLVFPRDSALFLADVLEGREAGSTKILSRLDRSALEELGSIITASFLTAMGNFLGVKTYPSTPVTVFDVAKSIVNFVLIGVNKDVDFGLVIKIDFKGSKGVITGYFLLLLDAVSLATLINLIDKTIEEGGIPVKKHKWASGLLNRFK